MNRKISGVFFSYLLIVVDILVGLLFVPFLLRGLGQDEYGLYRLLYSTAAYLSVLDFGLGGTITRYVVKYRTEGDLKKQENFMAMGLTVYAILAAITILVSFVITLIIPYMYQASISAPKMHRAQLTFLILCATHAVTLFSHAYTGLFAAYERFTYSKLSNILRILLRVIVIVIGIRFWPSAMLIALVDFLLSVALLIVHILYCKYSVKCKVKLHKWEGSLIKEMLVFTSAILVQAIITQFNTNVDSIVLGIYSTTEVIAMYSLVLQIHTMYSGLATSICVVYLPSISEAVFKGATDDEVTEKVIEPSRIQLLVLLLVASGFVLFGRDFIRLWVPGNDAVYGLVVLLMITSLLDLSQNTINSVLKAKNKLHGKSLILAISTAFNFLATLLLVPHFGVWGAAIGTAISLVFGYGVALNIYYHKVIHINMFTYYKKTYSGIVPATLLCLPIGFGIGYINPLHGWLGFLLEAGCYAVVFVIAMYLLGMNSSEKALIGKFLNKLGIRRRK